VGLFIGTRCAGPTSFCGPDLAAGPREIPKDAGLPLAYGHQHSNWVASTDGRPDRKTSSSAHWMNQRQNETSLRFLPTAVAGGCGFRCSYPALLGHDSHRQHPNSKLSGLRHGEDRLEGASQRPYLLSSSTVECPAKYTGAPSLRPGLQVGSNLVAKVRGRHSIGWSKVFLHRRIRSTHGRFQLRALRFLPWVWFLFEACVR
jgi:hypothetical protein